MHSNSMDYNSPQPTLGSKLCPYSSLCLLEAFDSINHTKAMSASKRHCWVTTSTILACLEWSQAELTDSYSAQPFFLLIAL